MKKKEDLNQIQILVFHSIQPHFGTSIIKHDLAERSQSRPMAYPEHSDTYVHKNKEQIKFVGKFNKAKLLM